MLHITYKFPKFEHLSEKRFISTVKIIFKNLLEMITGEYASAIDNRGEMSTHRPIEKSQMSHATNVQIGGTVNNYAAHSPGMPHTPGISYVNGVGYLDVGTG